jgi:DNA-binding helix-hairpin-helix protein with protein kinase domain
VRTFCDLQGNETGLGRCLGQGGEGAVYSVPNWPTSVAKIYARRPDEHGARKLGAMVQLGNDVLAQVSAWPQNLLMDPRTGAVIGFLMPRVDAHDEIHKLYGPSDRKTAFPDANWAFLVRAARNLAAAFEAVHQHGHVIGDVNQGNVVVSRQATVRLIDCDSFQITHLGRTYPCRVGVPLFTPPELQGRKLNDIVRTQNHDRFGLAVLVFHLLFMGRHPFAGRHPERAIPVETALREGLFAFGREALRSGFEPPPWSLRLKDVTPSVAELFERAFGPAAIAGGDRPSAGEWVGTLERLEGRLVTCKDDPRHAHAQANGCCPWCRIENDGGPSFFFLTPGAAPDAFDAAASWRSIEAVESPGSVPPPEPDASAPAGGAPGLATAALRALRAVFGELALRRSERLRDEVERERQAIAACEGNLRRLESQWKELCSERPFLERRRQLDEARASFGSLKSLEEREWAEVTDRYREKKLQPYLATFALEFARIPGLGPAELGRLAARGVVTAEDITAEKLMAIRGIDLELVRALLLYKGVATRAFRFDAVTGIPGRERKALADRQARRRAEIVKTLQAGALELAEVRRQTLAWRDVVGKAFREQQGKLAQLRAHALWV